jgi:hypothetical protein
MDKKIPKQQKEKITVILNREIIPGEHRIFLFTSSRI